MSIPTFQALFLPVLKALADQKALPIADIREHVRSSEGLSESDCRQMLSSGRQPVFDNRIQWALAHLTKAGLIDRPYRGQYELTDGGKELLGEGPAQIDMASLRRYPTYVKWRSTFSSPRTVGSEDSLDSEERDGRTPEDEIELGAKKLQSMLEAEVLESVQKCSPFFLERVVIKLLIKMGYGGGNPDMGAVTGRSGDGGIDGKIRQDALGLDEIYIQAKKYDPDNPVGEPALRNFAGALDSFATKKGVFVTTSDFSKPAQSYAERISKRIVLIDGKELARLMVLHGIGVRTQATYEVKQIDKEFYDLE